MQGECNGKTRERSFIRLDTAEPKLIFYKDSANEWQKNLLLFVRVQLIFYKYIVFVLIRQLHAHFL